MKTVIDLILVQVSWCKTSNSEPRMDELKNSFYLNQREINMNNFFREFHEFFQLTTFPMWIDLNGRREFFFRTNNRCTKWNGLKIVIVIETQETNKLWVCDISLMTRTCTKMSVMYYLLIIGFSLIHSTIGKFVDHTNG